MKLLGEKEMFFIAQTMARVLYDDSFYSASLKVAVDLALKIKRGSK